MSPNQMAAASVFRFGSFELDAKNGVLRREGAPVKLPPQPFKVLVLLATRSGQLVTREEIQQQVWGDETFVDFELGLNYCLNQIRTILGDHPQAPHYIETVHKRGYRFIAPVETVVPVPSAAASEARTPLLLKIESIAVLPLQNLSHDPEQEYFADGMTEELITVLGKIRGLRVISRTSVARYKKTDWSLPRIAKELNADAVIEGAVLRVGDRVRITAQLIEGATDRHRWAESYERDLKDILALQAELAQSIAHDVKAEVAPGEQARLLSHRPVNPEAYDLYLRGKMFQDSDNKAAMEVLERAVAIDPKFAPAYAALASVYWVTLLFCEPKDLWRYKAEAAVERALSLDPDLAEAHVSRAALLWTQTTGWQHEKGIQECRWALALNPNMAEGHVMLARIFDHVGLLDEALHELQTATGINPTQPDAAYFTGLSLFWSGKFKDALPFLSAGSNSLLAGTKSLQSLALWELGRKREAWSQTRELLKTDPQETDVALATVHTLLMADTGKAREAEKRIKEKILKQAEKLRSYGHFHHVANLVASIYARLNKPEQAVAWLEETVATGFPCYPYFECDRALNPIRKHPRFVAFMQKLKPQWEYFKSTYGANATAPGPGKQ